MAKQEKAKPTAGATPRTEVTIRADGRDSAPVTVHYEIPSDLDGLVAKFGENIVASKASEKITINLQDYLRGVAKRDPNANLQELADKWMPGIRPRGKSKTEKAKALFEGMSDEDRAALLKELQG